MKDRVGQKTLTTWGRTLSARMQACAPSDETALGRRLDGLGQTGGIAYGQGRSYGDAPLNHGGTAILTSELNAAELQDDDGNEPLIVCDAGVTFADLLKVYLPQGLIAPVTPGTAFATIGGAVANDIHGKNHDAVGSFGNHVEWLDLVLPDGTVRRLSLHALADADSPEGRLLKATIGGCGLTGVISRVCFRMKRVRSSYLNVTKQRVPNLETFIARLLVARETADYSVGWIDALAGGAQRGRGIVETGSFADDGDFVLPIKRTMSVPFSLPQITLSSASVRAFNALYSRRATETPATTRVPASSFFYPLDAIHNWNRIYGRRGFYQFQCVIPDDAAYVALNEMLEAISHHGHASFLAVLKTLGGPGRGYLSFPMRGFTLALDFPNRPGTAALYARLEAITLAHAGRIYLAKDALMSVAGFAQMYPQLDEFREVLDRVDPQQRMQSDMARRLQIRDYAG